MVINGNNFNQDDNGHQNWEEPVWIDSFFCCSFCAHVFRLNCALPVLYQCFTSVPEGQPPSWSSFLVLSAKSCPHNACSASLEKRRARWKRRFQPKKERRIFRRKGLAN